MFLIGKTDNNLQYVLLEMRNSDALEPFPIVSEPDQ